LRQLTTSPSAELRFVVTLEHVSEVAEVSVRTASLFPNLEPFRPVRPGVPDAFLALSELNERVRPHIPSLNSDLTCGKCALMLINFDSIYPIKRQQKFCIYVLKISFLPPTSMLLFPFCISYFTNIHLCIRIFFYIYQ
jgi:hypothetical protein